MSTTATDTRKFAAGVAAVVLTLAAGGAATAMNLAGNDVTTPAGKFAPTELLSTPASGGPSEPDTTVAATADSTQTTDVATTSDVTTGGHPDDDNAGAGTDSERHETNERHEGADDDD